MEHRKRLQADIATMEAALEGTTETIFDSETHSHRANDTFSEKGEVTSEESKR